MVGYCKDCRFWLNEKEGESGDCRLFSDDPNIAPEHQWPPIASAPAKLACVCPFAGADGGGLITEAMFGCVQYQPREVKP